jgi:hypothetical protein
MTPRRPLWRRRGERTQVATEHFAGEERTIITATTNVKTTGGRIFRVLVVSGTGAVDVYDHPSANSNQVFARTTTAVGDSYTLDVPCKFGIRVVMAAAGTICIVWS